MQAITSLAILAIGVRAGYDEFYFAIPSNDYASCPDLGFACSGPDNVCVHDATADKYYCCSGTDYPLCRAYATECSGSNGGPSSGQTGCEDNSWCCLDGTERCTQRTSMWTVESSKMASPTVTDPTTSRSVQYLHCNPAKHHSKPQRRSVERNLLFAVLGVQ